MTHVMRQGDTYLVTSTFKADELDIYLQDAASVVRGIREDIEDRELYGGISRCITVQLPDGRFETTSNPEHPLNKKD